MKCYLLESSSTKKQDTVSYRSTAEPPGGGHYITSRSFLILASLDGIHHGPWSFLYVLHSRRQLLVHGDIVFNLLRFRFDDTSCQHDGFTNQPRSFQPELVIPVVGLCFEHPCMRLDFVTCETIGRGEEVVCDITLVWNSEAEFPLRQDDKRPVVRGRRWIRRQYRVEP